MGGLALKASEIKPIPFSQPTSPEILQLRQQQATVTQTKLRKDVTRYRYGQEVHLDEALEKLGLSPTDEERPTLVAIRETAVDSAYCLTLEFESPLLPLEKWLAKQEKIERYFGPGIRAEIKQVDEEKIDLALITILLTKIPTVLAPLLLSCVSTERVCSRSYDSKLWFPHF